MPGFHDPSPRTQQCEAVIFDCLSGADQIDTRELFEDLRTGPLHVRLPIAVVLVLIRVQVRVILLRQ
jgi:hypothetical protein